MWDALVKECSECTEEVIELRGEIAGVSDTAKKLVEEKNGSVYITATPQQRNDTDSHRNDEFIERLRREVSSLRAELQQEKMIWEKVFKILGGVAEQTINTHETVKILNGRLRITRDYIYRSHLDGGHV